MTFATNNNFILLLELKGLEAIKVTN